MQTNENSAAKLLLIFHNNVENKFIHLSKKVKNFWTGTKMKRILFHS